MYIIIDKNGYVASYAIIGSFENAIEVEDPEDKDDFAEKYMAYHYVNGSLEFDNNKYEDALLEKRKNEIRINRMRICFPIINRGELWYGLLTEQQKGNLREWYFAWLDAPETMIEPEMPDWLKELV